MGSVAPSVTHRASSPTPSGWSSRHRYAARHGPRSGQGAGHAPRSTGGPTLLVDVSHRIHEHPELGYEELFAHDLLTGVIAEEGARGRAPRLRRGHRLRRPGRRRRADRGRVLRVRRPARHRPRLRPQHHRRRRARRRAGRRGAGRARSAGGCVILGTPAEEGGGGKVRLIDAGAFDGVDAAMMVHPAGGDLRRMNVIAIQRVRRRPTTARPPTPPPSPSKGRNALDAAVLGYVNVAALRQHIRPTSGSTASSPTAATSPTSCRPGPRPSGTCGPATLRRLEQLKERVVACLRGGRRRPPAARWSSTGRSPIYADMRDNQPMVDLYAANAARAGPHRRPRPTTRFSVVGSTDMGNVSYVVPSIHPMIAVSPAAHLDPHPRVRRLRPGPGGRRGRARRGQGPGHDHRRPVAPTGRARAVATAAFGEASRGLIVAAPAVGRSRRKGSRAIRGRAGSTFYSRRP